MRQLPSDLSSKLNQSLQTIGNDANPKMEVLVSRAKNTVVDSTYWTVETIRETTGLGDVSVAPRRFRAYGRPNRIYEIHGRDGQVYTSIREYPDKLGKGFKTQFSLGPGTSVAIAFNGYWERYRKLWRLITDEKPWIFWVDNTGILWRQLWDDVSTKTQLDTSVARVRAIRAWKNVNMPDKDQGIVVGYIKTDGTVWYRNYCQQEDYSYVWESARQLTQFVSTALSLNMFLTNDYRMGFIIEASNGQVHWLITPRNWAGMGIPAEKLTGTVDSSLAFIAINYKERSVAEILLTEQAISTELLFSRTDNSVVKVENTPILRFNDNNEEYQDYGFVINIRLKYETVSTPTFTITDATTLVPYSASSVVTEEAGYEFNINIDSTVHEFGINAVEGSILIGITGFTNPAGLAYDVIEHSFTPSGLIPPAIAIPEVEVIWNE